MNRKLSKRKLFEFFLVLLFGDFVCYLFLENLEVFLTNILLTISVVVGVCLRSIPGLFDAEEDDDIFTI